MTGQAALSVATLAARVDGVADEYYQAVLNDRPEISYLMGLSPPHHDGLTDVAPEARRAWELREDHWLAVLHTIDPLALEGQPQWITHGILREHLEAALDLRVCHPDWWAGVNHMDSWHLRLAKLAQLQPTETEEERVEALERWQQVSRFVRQTMANLRTGLKEGYSAPRPVAERMLAQIEGLLATPLQDHPYARPAIRSSDSAFKAAYLAILSDQVIPVLHEYREFLAREYLSKARLSLAATALPSGKRGYAALLRANTTLAHDADEVYARGQQIVARYRDEVQEIGHRVYGIHELAALAVYGREASDNQFADSAAILAASREMVARAERIMPRYFDPVPSQHVVIKAMPAYEDGPGAVAHYQPSTVNGQPGIYWISLLRAGGTSRAEAEITAFHETWPGHHLQLSYGLRTSKAHPLVALHMNAGFLEGWARYAEGLAEEIGLYSSEYAKIQRRAWPARGMVLDAGIHAKQWTREQAIDFAMESGRFTRPAADALVDRIAALPGQLAAYDSGGQEFISLRREAEAALGSRFDIRSFHDVVLRNGTLTLPMLRTRVEAWIHSNTQVAVGSADPG